MSQPPQDPGGPWPGPSPWPGPDRSPGPPPPAEPYPPGGSDPTGGTLPPSEVYPPLPLPDRRPRDREPDPEWRPEWPSEQSGRTSAAPGADGAPAGPVADPGRRARRAGRGRDVEEHRPRLAGLLRAEVSRFVSRRFIRRLLGLAVLAYLVGVPLIGWTQFAKTTDEVRAQAEVAIDDLVRQQNVARQACVDGPRPEGTPADASPDEYCGPAATAADFRVEDFLPKRSFVLADYAGPGALAVGAAVAAMFFVVGATWVGAEWSARTMVSLLFWETRRIRVLVTKTVVLVGATALFAAAAQAVWAGSAYALARTRGSTGPLPRGFWTGLAESGGRSVLLAVLVALLGMGVANLIRGTGAALGVGFVYFAIVENAVGAVRPAWQEWLLQTNAAALVLKGGTTIFVPGKAVDQQSGEIVEFVEKNVSNLHGGLVLGGVAAVLLVIGTWSFTRRDLT